MKSLAMIQFWTLYVREVRRFWRVIGQTVATPIVNSTLYLLIFGVSLGKSIQLNNNLSYLAFLIPGLVMMAALNNAFQNSSSSVFNSKFNGDLQDLRVIPLSSKQIVWAYAFGGMTRGFLVGLVTFIVGEIFHYMTLGTLLSIHNFGFLLLFLMIGSLAFAMLGVSISFWAKSFDQLSAIGSFVLLPLMYLGGVFFSLKNLHPYWQTLSQANPLLYFINGVRYGLVGFSDVDVMTSLYVSILSLCVLYFLAMRSVKHGSYAKW